MNLKAVLALILSLFFAVSVSDSLAQSASSSDDDALNAVSTLLALHNSRTLPSCSAISSKGKEILPGGSQLSSG